MIEHRSANDDSSYRGSHGNSAAHDEDTGLALLGLLGVDGSGYAVPQSVGNSGLMVLEPTAQLFSPIFLLFHIRVVFGSR